MRRKVRRTTDEMSPFYTEKMTNSLSNAPRKFSYRSCIGWVVCRSDISNLVCHSHSFSLLFSTFFLDVPQAFLFRWSMYKARYIYMHKNNQRFRLYAERQKVQSRLIRLIDFHFNRQSPLTAPISPACIALFSK